MQVSSYTTAVARKNHYIEAMKMLDAGFQWKTLDNEDSVRIRNLNEGKETFFCRACNCVFDPKEESEFCSADCALQFCKCGQKRKSRLVTDFSKLGRDPLGELPALVDLASRLKHRSLVESCATVHDFAPHFKKVEERREAEKCCEGVAGFVDARHCQKCRSEQQWLGQCQDTFYKVASGRVTWPHCQAAADTLAEFRMYNPKVEQLYCEACDGEPARKKQRV
jgi:hypothetical protein